MYSDEAVTINQTNKRCTFVNKWLNKARIGTKYVDLRGSVCDKKWRKEGDNRNTATAHGEAKDQVVTASPKVPSNKHAYNWFWRKTKVKTAIRSLIFRPDLLARSMSGNSIAQKTLATHANVTCNITDLQQRAHVASNIRSIIDT